MNNLAKKIGLAGLALALEPGSIITEYYAQQNYNKSFPDRENEEVYILKGNSIALFLVGAGMYHGDNHSCD